MPSQQEILAMPAEVRLLRQRVAKLERTVAFLLDQLKLQYVDTPPSEHEYPGVVELMQKGKKLEAVALYRQLTGVGLDEAKSYIETLD
jgi:ribosomal protein L7/L12